MKHLRKDAGARIAGKKVLVSLDAASWDLSAQLLPPPDQLLQIGETSFQSGRIQLIDRELRRRKYWVHPDDRLTIARCGAGINQGRIHDLN